MMESRGSDYKPGPPTVDDVQIEDDGKNIIVHWNTTKDDFMSGEFAPSFYYAVQLYCDDKPMGEVELVDGDSFILRSPDRLKKYAAEVWSVDEEGDTGDPVRSDWHMIAAEEYNLMKQLSKYDHLLKKTINEETDTTRKNRLEEIHQIISKFDGNLVAEECDVSLSMSTLREYEEELRQLIPLPDITEVKLNKDKKGDILVSWSLCEWPRNLQTLVKVCRDDGHECDPAVIQGSMYHIVSPEPTVKYHVELCCVDSDKEGKLTKSDEIMICKDLGKVLVDYTKPIGANRNVFEGYVRGARGRLEKVAVKVVQSNDRLDRELAIAEKLQRHRNTVQYMGSGDIGDDGLRAYIILELCKKDTLYEMVKKSKLRGTKGKIALMHVMVGLSFIHSNKIKHRDLKPQNILCSLTGEDLKIADFGLSKEGRSGVSKSAPVIGTEGWGSPESFPSTAGIMSGSPEGFAGTAGILSGSPEGFAGTAGIMSDKSDIYSAGLVVFFVLSDGRHAFGVRHDKWTTSIIDGDPVDYSFLVCDDVEIAKDLIEKMLHRIPESRPTSEEALAHPFFWDEKRRLDFLRMIAKFFAKFTYSEKREKPEGNVADIVKELEGNGEIIKSESGKNNWIERMKDYKGDKSRLDIVLEKAMEKDMKYIPSCVFQLLRFIRNTHEHFLEGSLKTVFKNSIDIWMFFSELFPQLFCTVYNATSSRWSELKAYPDFPDEADDLLRRPPLYRPIVFNRSGNILRLTFLTLEANRGTGILRLHYAEPTSEFRISTT